MYYVYILNNNSDTTIYIGFTRDLGRRICEHNRGLCFTTLHKKWSIQWYCVFRDKDKALSFEKYLKHGSGHAFMKKRFL